MTAGDPLDQLRARWLETDDVGRAAVVHAGVIDRARQARQRPAWLAILDQGWQGTLVGASVVGRRSVAMGTVLVLLLALPLVGLVLGSRPVVDAGRFIPVGTLSAERSWGFSATPLANGRVLVLGGFGPYPNGTPVDTAEVWDPSTLTISLTGAPADARGTHTATLLADGRVLVTGGMMYASGGHTGDGSRVDDGERPGSSAEIWDPATGLFTRTGSLVVGRDRHSATLLDDGRVLIVGGSGLDQIHASAELWDPATDSFRLLASQSGATEDHSATRLADGRILIVGGRSSQAGVVMQPFAEVFDPRTETFTPTGPPTLARSGHVAGLLPDGSVLVVGGSDDDAGFVRAAEIWDPRTDRFAVAAALPPEAEGSSLAILRDGQVFIIPPVEADGAPDVTVTSSVEVWEPTTGLGIPAGMLASPRRGGRATVLSDGTVLVLGGELPPVTQDPATCVKQRGQCAVVDVGNLIVELWTPSLP